MDPRKQPTVTNTHFGVSQTTGSDIEGAVLNLYRSHDAPDRRAANTAPFCRTQYGDLNNRLYPSQKEATQAALEHGYIRFYGRNLCEFQQSRAARRRGYISRNPRYLRQVKHWEERMKHLCSRCRKPLNYKGDCFYCPQD